MFAFKTGAITLSLNPCLLPINKFTHDVDDDEEEEEDNDKSLIYIFSFFHILIVVHRTVLSLFAIILKSYDPNTP